MAGETQAMVVEVKARATELVADWAANACSNDWHCSPAIQNHMPIGQCHIRACSTLQTTRKNQRKRRLGCRSWTNSLRSRWEWREVMVVVMAAAWVVKGTAAAEMGMEALA